MDSTAGARPPRARPAVVQAPSRRGWGEYDRRGGDRTERAAPVDATPEGLRALEACRDIDVHVGYTIAHLVGEDDALLRLGATVASLAPGVGHVCAELDAPERLLRTEHDVDVRWPDADAWRAALASSRAVATPDEADRPGDAHPLVLDGHRLYLARYWRYERRLGSALRDRADTIREEVVDDPLREGLERLHRSDRDDAGLPLQRIAAATAMLRGLTVVTGGPGTGKTTTVLRMLALLVERALARYEVPPRIVLAAPTGKAAARLGEAIRNGLAALPVSEEVKQYLPITASTVHRLLRVRRDAPTRFHHCAADPLPADVVVVDECSMAGLPLMAKLVDAVPAGARLILLGDRDQLASVEAGAILADVCGDTDARGTRAFAARIAAVSGAAAWTDGAGEVAPAIADCVVRLAVSRRFDPNAGIGALARAINAGDADAVLDLFGVDGGTGDATGEVEFVALEGGRTSRPGEPTPWIRRLAARPYRDVVGAEGPKAALDALDTFRVLAAHREGALGVSGLVTAVRRALAEDGTVPRGAEAWFHGQPVLVTANAPALDLYNGDVGVLLRDGSGAGAPLRAWFRTSDGGVRALSAARLPAHETAFVMTVHKAQGSEFDAVTLVLPERASPVVTRELLYTAVTRARRRVTVVGTPEVVRAAVSRRLERSSGLRAVLWGMS